MCGWVRAFLGVLVAGLLACAPASDTTPDADVVDAEAAETGIQPRASDAPPREGQPMRADDQQAPPNTLSESERLQGWRLLFDGRTTAGWRGYKQPGMPSGWEAVDGALTRTGATTDIVTVDRFRNFELALEWRVAPGGNSGIFFRAVEGEGAIYEYAPEVQVLDDAGHADGRSELTSAGSNFALHPVPRGIVRPAGEWNGVRIRVEGNRVQQWLNGTLVVEYEIGSEDWKRRVAESKFAAWPEYGLAPEGHIGLQEHGNQVAFRSIKVRVLP
jgi:hypothetical protein